MVIYDTVHTQELYFSFFIFSIFFNSSIFTAECKIVRAIYSMLRGLASLLGLSCLHGVDNSSLMEAGELTILRYKEFFSRGLKILRSEWR